ncbi:NosD domain-containing protein [Streptomyces sp. KL116D]|uniref:NosD domain-containing protein n=1 Tax=Streptomyces sp. KL116D TaxID=3045152 RepID=UPI003556E5C2
MSFDPNDYVFAKRLTVPRRVLLDASGASTLFAQFTVAGGGLSAASAVTFGVSATGATVLVNTADAALDGIKVVSQRRPAAHRHPARRRCDRCEHQPVHDARRRPDISSYGINLTTGSATVTDPAISGVATGITATAASTASGIAIKGGTVSGATSGISLGTATAPAVTGTTVTNTATTGTGIDLANSSSATLTSPTVTGFSRGIGASTTSTAPGPTIDAARVTGAGREGIALGSTDKATVTSAHVTGTDTANSVGIQIHKATGVTLDQPVVSHFSNGVYTHLDNEGAGPKITSRWSPRVTTGAHRPRLDPRRERHRTGAHGRRHRKRHQPDERRPGNRHRRDNQRLQHRRRNTELLHARLRPHRHHAQGSEDHRSGGLLHRHLAARHEEPRDQ